VIVVVAVVDYKIVILQSADRAEPLIVGAPGTIEETAVNLDTHQNVLLSKDTVKQILEYAKNDDRISHREIASTTC
jgi:hypothetical protein